MFPLYDINPTRRFPLVTAMIIAINLAVALWTSVMPAIRYATLLTEHGFVPARIAQLTNPQLVVNVELDLDPATLPPDKAGKPLSIKLAAEPMQIYSSLITMMFLHGGWMHFALNMWMLWIFGNNVEDRLGKILYAIFYLTGGLAACGVHYAIDPTSTMPVVGASGAIAAVLGGYLVTFPFARIRTLILIIVFPLLFDIPAFIWLSIWFLFQLATALGALKLNQLDNVAWWAHIGGFLSGLVLMPLLTLGAATSNAEWQRETEELFGPQNK